MVVDLWFPARGRTLPADHGYLLYSALCRELRELHGAAWWGLHTLRGERLGNGAISLSRRARLGLRLASEHIPLVLSLAGSRLRVGRDGENVLHLGPPSVHALRPAPAVSARMVTIKGAMEAPDVLAALRRATDARKIPCDIELGRRHIVRISGKNIVGYATRLTSLESRHSLQIQTEGLGGRRRFGCGLFRPSARPLSPERRPAAK